MQNFFENGLQFSCTKCSACCRGDEGFVFLSNDDIKNLCEHLKLSKKNFIERFCRFIPTYENEAYLSLLETKNHDCIFWNEGCSVYAARPVQCQTYPFWTGFLESREAWEAEKKNCAGINAGVLHDKVEIEKIKMRYEKNECAIFSLDEQKEYLVKTESYFIARGAK